ncbi:ABC transporter permease [bacterium]|nr:ABC transporter permease [candidate division CSSED10-310 bacterium]
MDKFLFYLGAPILRFINEAGRLALLLIDTLKWLFRRPFRIALVFKHMEEIGVRSLPVVMITATFTGGILALQSYSSFKRFNAESLIGTMVAIALCRELAPVLTGLIVAGRVGSAMAAELGTMRVTEQIDALYTLAVNPVHYLIVPRFIAAFIMMPILTMLADGLGIGGGFLVSTQVYGLNPTVYIRASFNYLEYEDVYSGLIKSAVFGLTIALTGCYKGFYTSGGAEGVGKATTSAVVISMMLILIIDYFMGALFFSV